MTTSSGIGDFVQRSVESQYMAQAKMPNAESSIAPPSANKEPAVLVLKGSLKAFSEDKNWAESEQYRLDSMQLSKQIELKEPDPLLLKIIFLRKLLEQDSRAVNEKYAQMHSDLMGQKKVQNLDPAKTSKHSAPSALDQKIKQLAETRNAELKVISNQFNDLFIPIAKDWMNGLKEKNAGYKLSALHFELIVRPCVDYVLDNRFMLDSKLAEQELKELENWIPYLDSRTIIFIQDKLLKHKMEWVEKPENQKKEESQQKILKDLNQALKKREKEIYEQLPPDQKIMHKSVDLEDSLKALVIFLVKNKLNPEMIDQLKTMLKALNADFRSIIELQSKIVKEKKEGDHKSDISFQFVFVGYCMLIEAFKSLDLIFKNEKEINGLLKAATEEVEKLAGVPSQAKEYVKLIFEAEKLHNKYFLKNSTSKGLSTIVFFESALSSEELEAQIVEAKGLMDRHKSIQKDLEKQLNLSGDLQKFLFDNKSQLHQTVVQILISNSYMGNSEAQVKKMNLMIEFLEFLVKEPDMDDFTLNVCRNKLDKLIKYREARKNATPETQQKLNNLENQYQKFHLTLRELFKPFRESEDGAFTFRRPNQNFDNSLLLNYFKSIHHLMHEIESGKYSDLFKQPTDPLAELIQVDIDNSMMDKLQYPASISADYFIGTRSLHANVIDLISEEIQEAFGSFPRYKSQWNAEISKVLFDVQGEYLVFKSGVDLTAIESLNISGEQKNFLKQMLAYKNSKLSLKYSHLKKMDRESHLEYINRLLKRQDLIDFFVELASCVDPIMFKVRTAYLLQDQLKTHKNQIQGKSEIEIARANSALLNNMYYRQGLTQITLIDITMSVIEKSVEKLLVDLSDTLSNGTLSKDLLDEAIKVLTQIEKTLKSHNKVFGNQSYFFKESKGERVFVANVFDCIQAFKIALEKQSEMLPLLKSIKDEKEKLIKNKDKNTLSKMIQLNHILELKSELRTKYLPKDNGGLESKDEKEYLLPVIINALYTRNTEEFEKLQSEIVLDAYKIFNGKLKIDTAQDYSSFLSSFDPMIRLFKNFIAEDESDLRWIERRAQFPFELDKEELEAIRKTFDQAQSLKDKNAKKKAAKPAEKKDSDKKLTRKEMLEKRIKSFQKTISKLEKHKKDLVELKPTFEDFLKSKLDFEKKQEKVNKALNKEDLFDDYE